MDLNQSENPELSKNSEYVNTPAYDPSYTCDSTFPMGQVLLMSHTPYSSSRAHLSPPNEQGSVICLLLSEAICHLK